MNLHTDEGHGGRSTGTPALGIPEKDYVLEIGGMIYDAAGPLGFGRSRSRSHDTAMTFAERGRRSAKAKAHLVLSLHVNAGVGAYARGVELYVPRGNAWSREVAEAIRDAMPVELRDVRRSPRIIEAWVKPEDRIKRIRDKAEETHGKTYWKRKAQTVIEPHVAPIVVLVELGFGNNPHDREILLLRWGKQAVVAACLAGASRAAKLLGE